MYAYTFRSRAERVLWTLEELGLSYNIVRANPFDADFDNKEMLELNPEGKVPILVHGNKVLLESLAIMEYLNSISNSGHLVPEAGERNYIFRRKLHFGLTEIEPYLWLAEQSNGPLRRFYTWPAGVYAESIKRVEKSCASVGMFITDSGYMLDNAFSIADIYFYHVLTWAKQHGIEHEPIVENYLSQLENRQAFPREMYWASARNE